jgi:negative regulator of flagellin synthesis FlgM
MKINDVQRIGSVNPYKSMDMALTKSEGKKQKKQDEVNISSEAKELQNINNPNSQVEKLRQSYKTGTYYVDASKIAEKLLPYIN